MSYAPKEPHHLRYAAARGKAVPAAMVERISRDAVALCEALGYDLNTAEFAVRDGVPVAIDFMNAAPTRTFTPSARRTSTGSSGRWPTS